MMTSPHPAIELKYLSKIETPLYAGGRWPIVAQRQRLAGEIGISRATVMNQIKYLPMPAINLVYRQGDKFPKNLPRCSSTTPTRLQHLPVKADEEDVLRCSSELL